MAKVLVIDDEPSIATLVAEVIEDYGHEVAIAFNGREGLELAKTGEYKLIISDIMMPYVNGCDLLLNVRADENLVHTNFVLMSAVAHLATLDESISADAFVAKPFDISTIDNLVTTFLEAPAPERQIMMPNPIYAMNTKKQRV